MKKPSIRCQGLIQYPKIFADNLLILPDGQTLLTNDGDEIQLWNIATRELQAVWAERPRLGTCDDVALTPDGRFLIHEHREEGIRFWEIQTQTLHHTLILPEIIEAPPPSYLNYYEVYRQRVSSYTFSPDGRYLVVGMNGRYTYIWDLYDPDRPFMQIKQGQSLFAFTPDGQTLVGSYQGSLEIWDWYIQEQPPDRKFLGQVLYLEMVMPQPTRPQHFSVDCTRELGSFVKLLMGSDGTQVVGGHITGLISFWRIATGKRLSTINAHSDGVKALRWVPQEFAVAAFGEAFSSAPILVSASRDKTIKFWHGLSGELLATLEEHTHRVLELAFSLDGYTLISGGADAIRFWQPGG